GGRAGSHRVDGHSRPSVDLGGPAAGGGAGAPGGPSRGGLRLRRGAGSGRGRGDGAPDRSPFGGRSFGGDPGAAGASGPGPLAGDGGPGAGAPSLRLAPGGRATRPGLRALGGGDAEGGVDLLAVELNGVPDDAMGFLGALQGADL